jgi:hypothetical protein
VERSVRLAEGWRPGLLCLPASSGSWPQARPCPAPVPTMDAFVVQK